jgi:hypothetical protein
MENQPSDFAERDLEEAHAQGGAPEGAMTRYEFIKRGLGDDTPAKVGIDYFADAVLSLDRVFDRIQNVGEDDTYTI